VYYRSMQNNLKPAQQKTRLNVFRWSANTRLIYVLVFAALTLVYLGFTLIPQPDKLVLRQYHLTVASYRWLLYPAILLFAVSWVLGVLGSVRIKDYSNLIKDSRDGRAFNVVAAGFLVLAISQPFTSLLSTVFGRIDRHVPRAVPSLTIINNYIALALTGLSLVLIAWGAEKLYSLTRRRRAALSQSWWVGAFILFGALYAYFIVIQPIHTPLQGRVYFLPNWLIITTIAVPYLFFWYAGLNAAYRMFLYQRNSQGRLYKHAFNYLASGIVVVIASSVAIRVITTLSNKLNHLTLTPILFIIYALVAASALGFLLIMIGANKLKKIEEV
jgi:hypothetical protein